MEEDYIKICPKCGSTNIKSDYLSQGLTSAKGFPIIHICESCNFSNNLFPEVPRNRAKDLQKEIIKGKKK